MIQEESRMKLHFESGGLSGARLTLVTLSSGMTGAQIETCKCYNCGEVGHLSKACPKPPKERETGRRGQFGGRGRDRGGRRGGRGGGYWANLMVDPLVEETCLTEEEHEFFELLKRKQKTTGDVGKKKIIDKTSTCDFGVTFLLCSFYHRYCTCSCL
jgi:Zinc knuckle